MFGTGRLQADGPLDAFVKSSFAESDDVMTASKYLNVKSYKFSREDMYGLSEGRVGLDNGSMFVMVERRDRQENGELSSRSYALQALFSGTLFHELSFCACRLTTQTIKMGQPSINTHYSFLPHGWNYFSQSLSVSTLFNSAPKSVSFEAELKEGRIQLTILAPPTGKSRISALDSPIRLERLEAGQDGELRVEQKWKTIDGHNLLAHATYYDTQAKVQMKFAAEVDAQPLKVPTMGEFLKSLPDGIQHTTLDARNQVKSRVYLGKNPATAKLDYERRLKGEEFKRMKSIEKMSK